MEPIERFANHWLKTTGIQL